MLNPRTRGNNFYHQDFAVSEVVGVIFLMGIVSTAIIIIILAGYNVISSAQSESKINAMEQAFTVADSRISKARFSTSIYQEVPLELRDGMIYVNGSWDDSHIQLFDINSTTHEQHMIYNSTLGTIGSIFDQCEVGYQGGGVWKLDNNNGSVMISPPDFDYNEITLTLPIMILNGNSSLAVSGNKKAAICVNASDSILKFPDSTFGNPIPSDHFINVTIKSKYYRAWADYINTRTRAHSIIDPINKTVNVSLRAGAPLQTGPAIYGFNTNGLDTSYDAPLETFNLDLTKKKGNAYKMTISATIPSGQRFMIFVDRSTGWPNHNQFGITFVYYDPNNGTEIWEAPVNNSRLLEIPIAIDFLDKTQTASYVGNDNHPIDEQNVKQEINLPGSLYSTSWGKYLNIPDNDPTKVDYVNYSDVTNDDTKTFNDISQHYLWLMSYLAQQSGTYVNFETVDFDYYNEDDSWIRIRYKSSKDIKYLYLTECTLNTTLGIRG